MRNYMTLKPPEMGKNVNAHNHHGSLRTDRGDRFGELVAQQHLNVFGLDR